MSEHILHGEEGGGRFFATSYSPAAFLPVQDAREYGNAVGVGQGDVRPLRQQRESEVMPIVQ